MSIRERIFNHMTKNPGKEFTAESISVKLKINSKSASVQLPILMTKEPSVTRKKVGRGFVYTLKSSGKEMVPLVKATKDVPSPAYEIPRPDDSMDLGNIVNRLVKTNQQNQMYKQALGQIASILEQIGIVEGV